MPAGIGISFILTHMLGFIADGMSDSRCPWGMWAFGAFWVSLLIWVPGLFDLEMISQVF